jgi:hypothetical protein
MLLTSRAAQGMLGLFYFVRGCEFYNTFDQCTEIDFLPARGDVEHGFCRRIGLSATRFGVIRVLLTSWATSGTLILSSFALWRLLGAPKCDSSKIEREGVPWPLMAAF